MLAILSWVSSKESLHFTGGNVDTSANLNSIQPILSYRTIVLVLPLWKGISEGIMVYGKQMGSVPGLLACFSVGESQHWGRVG